MLHPESGFDDVMDDPGDGRWYGVYVYVEVVNQIRKIERKKEA